MSIFYILYAYIYTPYDEKSEKKIVTIPPGSGSYFIGLTLENENLIHSPLLFYFYARFAGAGKHLQAGQYELNTRMSMADIVHIMQKGGKANQVQITIPEGFTLDQIVSSLNDKSIVPVEKFQIAVREKKYLERMKIHRDTLEGYLFPDTYQFFYNISGERVVDMMLNRFDEVAIPLYNKYSTQTKLTLDQTIILASIIEKEANNKKDMRLISGVFQNRLKRGMPLQSEATVRYALKRFSQTLTIDDLKNPSPYNTYRYLGLPAGPICNPGAEAIEAALNPENTNYLYFVTNNDGTAVFSYTLAEHNIAVAKYKKSIQLSNSQATDGLKPSGLSNKTTHHK